LTIDLGSRQYLDLDQDPVIGSLTLQPFTSKILVDNGPAPLTLQSIYPVLFDVTKPADFTLTVYGISFTANSVVRWKGSDRPTVFVSSTRLTATIFAADVSTTGVFPVTVRDPLPTPGGTETAPVMFYVVPIVYNIYLPHTSR
jgi:hypothetical protein